MSLKYHYNNITTTCNTYTFAELDGIAEKKLGLQINGVLRYVALTSNLFSANISNIRCYYQGVIYGVLKNI
jgi:hypothetical protein